MKLLPCGLSLLTAPATLADAVGPVLAQSDSTFHSPLTPAPGDVGGAGARAAEDAQAQAAKLAKKLQNPVASLISVPIQNNWDFGIGPEDALRYGANVQPVIPFSLNEDWNLITRTIMPVIFAASPVKGGADHSGLGDITESFFLSK
jgi:hypothetical protein